MKRLRHLPIVCGPTPSCVATTALLGSRSHASTILARIVSAAGSERDRVMAISCVRSSLEIVSIAFGRPVRIGYLLRSGYPKPMQLLCYELKGQNTRWSAPAPRFTPSQIFNQIDNGTEWAPQVINYSMTGAPRWGMRLRAAQGAPLQGSGRRKVQPSATVCDQSYARCTGAHK